MARGLLFVLSDPGSVDEALFHDWYDNEHAPARAALDGIHDGQRLRALDGERPPWLATYDLDLEVLDSPEYRALAELSSDRERSIMAELATLDRRVYELIDDHGGGTEQPAVVLASSLTVAPADEAALTAWLLEDHIPLLHEIPGWLRTRRYRLVEGSAPTVLALHELADPEPLETDAYRAATSTSRRAAVMATALERERRVFAHHRRF